MNCLKDIAKQWENISFKQLSNIYNNFKIVKPKDMVKLSNSKIAKDEILIMAVKKHKGPDKLDLIIERLDRIENRLTSVIKANNLIDPTQK